MLRPFAARTLGVFCVLVLVSCFGDSTGPGERRPGRVSFVPTFDVASSLVEFDEIHILLTRPPSDDVVLDTTIIFPAGEDSLVLAFDVPLESVSEELTLTLNLIDQPSGNIVFTVGPTPVTASLAGEPSVLPPFLYVGPGSNAVGVRFVNTASSVFFGDTARFTAEAFDAGNVTIPGTPIRWTVSDTSRATLVADSAGDVVGRNARGPVNVTASLLRTSPTSTPPSVVQSLAVQPRPSTIVAQSGSPQTGTVGSQLALPITGRVRATDNLGVQGVVVNFAVTAGGGSLSALQDTTDTNGDVSVTWTVGQTAGTNNQSVTATVQGLPSATVAFIASATPDGPVGLRFVQQPSNADELALIAPPVTVEAVDQFGNRATSFTGGVSLALFGGAGTLGGTLPRSAVAGLATFDDLTVSVAGTYRVAATFTGLTPDTSATFDIASIGPTHLTWEQQPGTTTAGVAIAPVVQVALRGANNQIIATATDNITIAFGANPGNGTLGGTLSVAAVNGVATFTDLVIDSARAGYTLTATSGALPTITSNAFNVTHAAAARLEFLVQPSNVNEAEVITPAIAVRAFDAIGNVASTFVGTVTLEILDNPGPGTIGGTTSRAAAGGVATFDDITISTPASGYTLRATSGALASDTSVTFDVAATIPTRLVIEVEPTTVEAGVVMAPSVQVSLRNNANTLITGATNPVTLSIANNVNGATLGGTLTQNPSGGLVTFPGITLDRTGTGYTLAVAAAGLVPDTSVAFNVIPGPATTLIISTQPPDSVLFDAPFTVSATALDAEGNVATTFGGTVTLGIATNPAGGSLYGVTTVGSSAGVATFGAMEIDNVGLDYVLSVSASGLTGATTTPVDVVAPGSANVWINLAGGNWSNALNWSKGLVPSTTDTIFIRQSGTYTVNLDVSATVEKLIVGGRAGLQTLQVNANTLTSQGVGTTTVGTAGRLVLASSGILTGPGGYEIFGTFDWISGQITGGAGLLTVMNGGQINISGTPIRYLTDYGVTIAGAGVWSDPGFIYTGSAGALTIAAGGSLDIQGDGQFLYNQGGAISAVTVQGGGVLNRSTSTGTAVIGGLLNNDGQVNLSTGTLQASGGGTGAGAWSIASGTTLNLAGGTHNLGSFLGDGVALVTAGTVNAGNMGFGGTLQLNGGTFNADGAALDITTVNVNGGTLGGSGQLNVTSSMSWSTGNLAGSGGTTTVVPGATLSWTGATARTFTNYNVLLQGTGTWTGTHTINTGSSAALTVAAGGTLDIQGDPAFTYNQGGAAPLLRNLGTITRMTSAGAAVMNVPVDNDGAINVATGILRLSNGSGPGTADGSYTAAPGATLEFSAGAHSLGATSSVSGAGTVLVSGSANVQAGGPWSVTGLTHVSAGRLDYDAASGSTTDLTVSGGNLGGAPGGLLAVGNAMIWSGGNLAGTGGEVRVAAGGSLLINGVAGRTFTNYTLGLDGAGTWTEAQQINTGSSATLRVGAAATLSVEGDPVFTYNQGGAAPLFQVMGGGTVTRAVSAGIAAINVPFDNDGTANVTTGTLRLQNGSGAGTADGGYLVSPGATLDFNGGTHALGATSTLGGSGTAQVSNGTVNAGGNWSHGGLTQVSGGTLNYSATGGSTTDLALSGGTLGGAAGGLLTIQNSMSWTGGNLAGSGGTALVASGGTLSISGATTRTFTNYTLALGGTGTWTGTQAINTGSGATVRVEAAASLDVQGDPSFQYNQGGAAPLIHVLGTLTRSTSLGIATFNAPFDNDGLTLITSGILRLQNGSGPDEAAGGYNASAGALLDFNGGTHNLGAAGGVVGGGTASISAGSVNVAGPWSVSGTTQVTGGTLNYNASAGTTSTLQLSGGTLGGSATGLFTVTGTMDWSGGNLAGGGGTTLVDAGASLTLSGAVTRTWTNYTLAVAGSGTWPGTHQINAGSVATLRVETGGSLDIQGDPSFIFNQGGGTPLFQVLPGGAVTRSTSAGIATMNVNYDNDGVTTATSGTLRLSNGSGAASEGSYDAQAPGVIDFSNGTHTLGAASQVIGTGTIQTSGGTVNASSTWLVNGTTSVIGGSANFNGASMQTTALSVSGGTLGGGAGGLLQVTGPMTWTGGNLAGSGGMTRVTAPGSLVVSGAVTRTMTNYTLENNSTAAVWSATGNFNTGSGAIVRNTGTMDIDAASGAFIFNQGGGAPLFENTGTLVKSTAATYTISTQFVSTGAINGTGGILNLNGGGFIDGTASLAAGSTLLFNGGTHTLGNGLVVTGAGFVMQSNGVVTQLAAADTAHVENLILNGGTLDQNGVVRVSGVAQWDGGNIQGAGTLLIPAPAVFNIAGTASRTFVNGDIENHGVTNWVGDLAIFTGVGARMLNMPGGTFSMTGSGNFTFNQGGTQTRFVNQGAFVKSGSTIPSGWTVAFDLVAGGTGSQILTDGLSLQGGGSWADSIDVAATLTLSGGTFSMANGQAVTGVGNVLFGPGILTTATAADTGRFENLELVAGSLQQPGVIQANGTLLWSDATSLQGTGVTRVAPSATFLLTGTASRQLVTGTLLNEGVADWSGAFSLFVGSNAALRNQGSFTVTGSGALTHNQGGTFDFANSATFTFNSPGTFPWGGRVVDTTGAFSVLQGTLQLDGTGRFGTGSVKTVAAGAVLELSGGTFTLQPGTAISGAGVVNLAAGTLSPDSNSLSLPVSMTNLQLNGGTLSHEGTLQITGVMDWNQGIIQSNFAAPDLGGTTRIMAGGTLNIASINSRTFVGNHTLQNDGTIIYSGSGSVFTGQSARILNSALFDWTGDGSFILNQGGTGTFQNAAAGTLRRSVSANVVNLDLVLNNLGTINVQTGTLGMSRGSITNFSGTATGAGILRFNGGTFTLTGPFTAGNVDVFNGNLVLNGQDMAVNGAFSTSNGGVLTMTNAADSLGIGGIALFNGGSTAGTMTAGLLTLAADFNQAGLSNSFAPSGTHRTALRGSVTQNINFEDPITSRFNRLETAANNRNIVLQTDMETVDSLHMLAGALPYQLTGPAARVRVGGVLRLEQQTGSPRIVVRLLELVGIPSVAPFNGMTADTTAFIGAANVSLPVGGPYVYNSIRLQTGGNFAMAADTISGNLEIVTGTALFNVGLTFRILGDLRTRNTGVYSQTSAGSLVTVVDSAVFAGGASTAISAGLLRLHGAFIQDGGSANAFQASGLHRTEIAGPLAGTAIQPVQMTGAGTGAANSRFSQLDLFRQGGIVKINLLSNVQSGWVRDSSNGFNDSIMGTGSVSFNVDSAALNNTVFTNARIALGSPTAVHGLNAVRFETMDPTSTYLTLQRNAGFQSTFNNMVFATTATTGFYVHINQVTGGTAASVSFPAPVTPGTPGGRINRTGAAGPPQVIWAGVLQP